MPLVQAEGLWPLYLFCAAIEVVERRCGLLAADFARDDEHGAVVFADNVGRHASSQERHDFARAIRANDHHVGGPIASSRDDAVDEFASKQFCLSVDSMFFQQLEAILDILWGVNVTARVLLGIEHRNKQHIGIFHREQSGGFVHRVNGRKTSVCRQEYLHSKHFRSFVVARQVFRENFNDVWVYFPYCFDNATATRPISSYGMGSFSGNAKLPFSLR